ncbi:tripartite tricarboxylate transporter substrate binding protein [Bradyrhizobium sp. NP1]|uniref:tripartite tricarboxylate transporter substrate binding protein n=1 Tax=Bradyrhizobium sp. NP1 TaxID=3049772 RepID=UPI0025A640CB|nr:tripartite tricarboxylate transporter substrate binding protein [Bradyrhizobium sp. NP1]WJR77282.1 tripartite tricarboxylate transporter substrate binding protein [Bradyrhizobium sp. NP1]
MRPRFGKLVAMAALGAAFLAGTGLLAAPQAGAQSASDTFPDRPIRIIVPFPAGGSVDTVGRVVAHGLNQKWGQPVIVENRPGASTMIGSAAVAKASPDGYTLLVAVSNHTTNAALYSKVPYDALTDFAPITLLAQTPVVLFAYPGLPANTLKELVELARKKPGELNFGSAGVGSMTHLTAELLKLRAGIDITHVPYRGGTPAMNDLIAGHVPLQFATVAQGLSQYQAGQIKALGISSAARYPSMPDVPTFAEQGFDVVTTEWYGLLAPAGTPAPLIARLNAAVNESLKAPELRSRLSIIDVVGSTPQALDGFIRAESGRWQPLIHQLGLKAD